MGVEYLVRSSVINELSASREDEGVQMHSYAQLRDAVREKKQVVAYYDDRRREMCPHLLGWRDDGTRWCLFYQFAGETSKGPIGPRNPPGWKCMDVQKLNRVQLRDGEWHTEHPKGGKYQRCMDHVEIEVSRQPGWW